MNTATSLRSRPLKAFAREASEKRPEAVGGGFICSLGNTGYYKLYCFSPIQMNKIHAMNCMSFL